MRKGDKKILEKNRSVSGNRLTVHANYIYNTRLETFCCVVDLDW